MVYQPLLDRHREEFLATVCLNPLQRKRHFFQDACHEHQCTYRRAPAEERRHSIARTNVTRGVLIASRSNRAGVELYAIPGNEPGIAVSCLPPN